MFAASSLLSIKLATYQMQLSKFWMHFLLLPTMVLAK